MLLNLAANGPIVRPTTIPDIDNVIVDALESTTKASAWMLSLHRDDGSEPVPLERGGVAKLDDALAAQLLERASRASARRAMRTSAGEDGRIEERYAANERLVCTLFAGSDSASAIVFSALVDASAPDSRNPASATRGVWDLIDAYFTLWQKQARMAHREETLAAALDAIDLGVILIDREGQIGFVNDMANAVLDEATVLRRRGAILAANTLTDTMRLQGAMALAISTNSVQQRDAALEKSALLKLVGGEQRLIVAVLPARVRAEHTGEVAAMLLILNPAGEMEQLVAPACSMYGLSGVETRLACHIVAGRSLQEASKQMRLKEQTARTYLKQVFLKTSVNRQVDLVRLLLSQLIRTRTNHIFQSA